MDQGAENNVGEVERKTLYLRTSLELSAHFSV